MNKYDAEESARGFFDGWDLTGAAENDAVPDMEYALREAHEAGERSRDVETSKKVAALEAKLNALRAVAREVSLRGCGTPAKCHFGASCLVCRSRAILDAVNREEE